MDDRCIAQLAKINIDRKFVELTAHFVRTFCTKYRIWYWRSWTVITFFCYYGWFTALWTKWLPLAASSVPMTEEFSVYNTYHRCVRRRSKTKQRSGLFHSEFIPGEFAQSIWWPGGSFAAVFSHVKSSPRYSRPWIQTASNISAVEQKKNRENA